MNTPKKILIVLLGAIGDVTRALPLAMRVKRAWPQAHLSWAIEPKSKGVIEGHPAIDHLIVFDRPRGLRGFIEFLGELRTAEFDLVLDLQRHLKSGISGFATRAPKRLGFHRKNAKEFNWLFNNSHIDPVENFSAKIDHYQKFGDKLGLPKMDRLQFGFQVDDSQLAVMEQLVRLESERARIEMPEPKRRVALILGSSWPSRFWFASHYVELIQELAERWGLVSLLVGSPNERPLANEILENAKHDATLDLVEKTSLSELRAVFANCRLAIGPDSGPMHIAAAMQIPVISLWGATSPKRSAPYGSEQLVLQSAIGCSPCYKRECPGLNNLCMFDIPSEAVVARVKSLIEPSSDRHP